MTKYDTTTRITNFNVNWLAIKSACMTTISKQAGKEPGREWKRKLLIWSFGNADIYYQNQLLEYSDYSDFS